MTALGRTTDTAGFGYRMDSYTARRQLHLSVGVVLVLALAIITAALSFDVRPVSAPSYVVSVPSATMQAERTESRVRS